MSAAIVVVVISRVLAWHRRRKRAVCLGDMGHARLWFDSEVGRFWQAKHRWSVLATPATPDSLDDAVQMLEIVHSCELYVDPDDPLDVEEGSQ